MMVSSTDSSDWNVSPPSRPTPNFIPQEPPTTALSETLETEAALPSTNRSSPTSTPRLGSFSVSKNLLNPRASLSEQNHAITSDSASPAQQPLSTDPLAASTYTENSDLGVSSIDFNNDQNISTAKAARGSTKATRRGRGGGSSRSRVKAEPNVEEIALADVPPVRAVNRGGRPRGSRAGATSNRGGRGRGNKAGASANLSKRPGKRKRRSNKSEDDNDGGNTSGSEAINLPMLSSSGRRITQANAFTTPVINLEAPGSSTMKKSRTATRIVDAAPVFLTGAMKRKLARNPAEAAVCRNCGRGHSPNSNQIVFCDGCETPWHQFCHDRPISPTVIQIEESEWHCADCEIEKSLKGIEQDRVTADSLAQSSGIHRTLKWKQDYLLEQSKETLVALLLKAHEALEDLPLFEQDPKAGFVATAAVIMYEGKTARMPTAREDDGGTAGKHRPNIEIEKGEEAPQGQDEDEGYYEEPLPYPKMGNGVVLPPEKDDLEILVDEDETLYSHSWKGDIGSFLQSRGVGQRSSLIVGCEYCGQKDRHGANGRLCRECEDGHMSEVPQDPLERFDRSASRWGVQV